MNHNLNNGKYILVARNLKDNSIIEIPINKAWYLEEEENTLLYRNDIASIDLFTMNYQNKEQLIEDLYQKKLIDTKDIDLYITHVKKNNNKYYVNEYEIILNNNRAEYLENIANLRISDKWINVKDTESLFNKYLTKMYYKKSFYTIMTSPWSKMDKHIISKSIEYRRHNKLDFSIKYVLKDKLTSYLAMRNLVSMWNIYDDLIVENKENLNINEDELSRFLLEKYWDFLDSKKKRVNAHDEIIRLSNKDYVPGQITLDQYFNDKKESNNDIGSPLFVVDGKVKKLDYNEQLIKMREEENSIRTSPFSYQKLNELEALYGRDGIKEHLTTEIIKTLNLEDKLRLGFIDIVDYRNLKWEEENGKSLH